jgi:hypothetical protein
VPDSDVRYTNGFSAPLHDELALCVMQGSIRKIVGGSVFFLITCGIAVVAYIASGWSLLDAIYMVIITVFGVGYGEIRPVEDPSLRVLTILLIVLGCSSTSPEDSFR